MIYQRQNVHILLLVYIILRSTGTESVYFTYPYQGRERNKYIGRVNFENLKVRVRNFFELMVRVRVRERADF